jgi:hypothetical protein
MTKKDKENLWNSMLEDIRELTEPLQKLMEA